MILFNKCGFIEQVKSFFSCLPECNISFVIKRNTKKERQEKGEIKGREEGRKKGRKKERTTPIKIVMIHENDK